MNTEFIREGNRTLYCFSIFYAQDEWGRILPLLHTYMMSNPDIHQYMFFLSYETKKRFWKTGWTACGRREK